MIEDARPGEAATHVMFMAGPENVHRTRMVGEFVDRYWRRDSR
jgi:hypothetical protein